ncbi:MAG: nitrogen regulation protein NR(II) [Alphaproteobacteria bacterium]|nr:nitrogen regulation protein NR(II) [Alphaproteobacteria bacterium]
MIRSAVPASASFGLDPSAWQGLDLMASMVWVAQLDGQILFANTAVQELLGLPRHLFVGQSLRDWLEQPADLDHALQGARQGDFAALRCDTLLKVGQDSLLVHMVLAPIEGCDQVLVEMLPIEQQTRQQREGRLMEQASANKELIRNLAHEIKNPLGGIRGAAQLLQMEVDSRDLIEYTQVIIREADRLQTLVDRLLEPHRKPHVVGNVNIHEVCERVRSLILAEFPRGLQVVRDYDTSLPEFRGDLEQLIQTVLNIAHNAAQALNSRMESGDARITLRTRVARQVTLGKQRYKLALELHVIDNGPGIPSALKDRLFLPLVSGREGGSGLGLHLAQTFVQQHHGLIEFESEPGRTDFKIFIPLP